MAPSIWCILYTNKVTKGNAKLITRISWYCLFSYFISELWGDGLWACPQLSRAATPDEAVSIICTDVDKTILQTLWGKLMYVSYITDRSVFHNLSLGSFDMVDLRLWDACQDDVAPGDFLLVQCACQLFFGLGTSTHVCSWSITDCYIIKRHVSHAWYWFWTTKALVEAEVLWWLYSDSRGHSSSVDPCQTFSVFMIRLAKKTVLKAKMLYWQWLCMYFICG